MRSPEPREKTCPATTLDLPLKQFLSSGPVGYSDIISYVVWLYCRFNLSHRDIEDLLVEQGITVSRESIRLWCIKFGAISTRRLKRKYRDYGDTSFIDEVFVKICGKQHYLWSAVDLDGEMVDVYLQAKSNAP